MTTSPTIPLVLCDLCSDKWLSVEVPINYRGLQLKREALRLFRPMEETVASDEPTTQKRMSGSKKDGNGHGEQEGGKKKGLMQTMLHLGPRSSNSHSKPRLAPLTTFSQAPSPLTTPSPLSGNRKFTFSPLPSRSPSTKTTGARPSTSIGHSPTSPSPLSPLSPLLGKGEPEEKKKRRSLPTNGPDELGFSYDGTEARREREEAERVESERYRREEDVLKDFKLMISVTGFYLDDSAMIQRKLVPYDIVALVPRHIYFDRPLATMHRTFFLKEAMVHITSHKDKENIPGWSHHSSKIKWTRRTIEIEERRLGIRAGWRDSELVAGFLLPPEEIQIINVDGTEVISIKGKGEGATTALIKPLSDRDLVHFRRVVGWCLVREQRGLRIEEDKREWRKEAVALAHGVRHKLVEIVPAPSASSRYRITSELTPPKNRPRPVYSRSTSNPLIDNASYATPTSSPISPTSTVSSHRSAFVSAVSSSPISPQSSISSRRTRSESRPAVVLEETFEDDEGNRQENLIVDSSTLTTSFGGDLDEDDPLTPTPGRIFHQIFPQSHTSTPASSVNPTPVARRAWSYSSLPKIGDDSLLPSVAIRPLNTSASHSHLGPQ